MTERDRRRYIGGGAIAAVINKSPHSTALQLWEAMTSDEPAAPPDPELEKFFRRRRQMEPIIVRMLREDHGIEVTKVSLEENANRYTDPIVSYFAAEIDAETVMTPALAEKFPKLANVPTGEVLNIEIKTSSEFARRIWGDEAEEEIPVHVAAQAHWGLGITARAACLVVPLIGLDDLRVYPIPHDPVISGWLRREAQAFWTMVQERRRPEPSTLAEVKRVAARLIGQPVDLDDETHEALQTLLAMRATESAAKKERERLEHVVFDYVRKQWSVPSDPTVDFPSDAAILRFNGKEIATWNRQTSTNIDAKRLRVEEPLVFKRYSSETAFRVLRARRG